MTEKTIKDIRIQILDFQDGGGLHWVAYVNGVRWTYGDCSTIDNGYAIAYAEIRAAGFKGEVKEG